MPKNTSTAVGSLGDGTPVKVPVSVTTVWAEAVATAAVRKSAAKARNTLRLGALLDMEIFLSGLESDVSADIVGVRVSPPAEGAVSS
jgi:hypothetical protein